MANSCFENFIGIKCLSQNAPKSGLYIDDLQGINLRFAADVADSGYISGAAMVENKINIATQIVMDEIARFSMPFFRMNSLIDEILVGEYQPGFNGSAAFMRGARITTRESRLIRIRVQSVEIRIQETNYSGNVEIVDGVDFAVFPFTTDANGRALIYPNYLSSTAEIFIVADNTNINPQKTKIKGSCNCSSKKSQFMIANGWTGTTTSSDSFGLVIQAVAECDQNQIACMLSQKLRFPIWYRAGIEIVTEALTTDRLNSVTLLDKEKCEFLLDLFGQEYDKTMKSAMEQLPDFFSRLDDICVVCNQSRYVQGNP
jgi:hypothetical protein